MWPGPLRVSGVTGPKHLHNAGGFFSEDSLLPSSPRVSYYCCFQLKELISNCYCYTAICLKARYNCMSDFQMAHEADGHALSVLEYRQQFLSNRYCYTAICLKARYNCMSDFQIAHEADGHALSVLEYRQRFLSNRYCYTAICLRARYSCMSDFQIAHEGMHCLYSSIDNNFCLTVIAILLSA
ncbi:hypothetical protein PoB_003498400 [Plakobranchus ocellatus]|uniref:Uncharacterized protein n=1 Tax=Plakobranchus ocellatus TaxID=259542 RepID=A0AAV4AL77_9GAST|nr:hypothetical protein PoB_003498400 [Plakobranchus ocellatus]